MNTINSLIAYNNDVAGEPTYFEAQGTVKIGYRQAYE